MADINTDKITDTRNAARPNSARVTVARSSGASSLSCDNLVGWPTASKVHFVTYQIDSAGDPVEGTQLDCAGIVSANAITNFTVYDGNDLGHAVGDVVEMLPTAKWGQDLADALLVSHNRSGSIKDGAINDADMLASDVVTNDKIAADAVTAGEIADGAVDPEHLTAGTGSDWAMQTWSPTYSNITVGNGTVNAGYIQMGKLVFWRWSLVLGSTSAIGANPTINLPITMKSILGNNIRQLAGILNDASAGDWNAISSYATASTIRIDYDDGTGGTNQVSATAPFTWVTTDRIDLMGWYEAA